MAIGIARLNHDKTYNAFGLNSSAERGESMISELLKSLFGKNQPSKRHRINPRRSSRQPVKSECHAVEVVSPVQVCDAAAKLAGVRILAGEAPVLPLADCTQGDSCACKYKHHQDRREGPRRDADIGLPNTYLDSDKRQSPGRRSADKLHRH